MTDHDNTDETDGQNSNLSRRTALGLMGASAVGGAAASSAYSELTADRPIDVEVSEDGDADLSEGNSELIITNGSSETLDATITVDDTSLFVVESSGEFDDLTSVEDDEWELVGLTSGNDATIEFVHDDTEEDEDKDVTFSVEAFSDTDGYSVTLSQLLSVAKAAVPMADMLQRYRVEDDVDQANDGEELTTLTDLSGNGYDATVEDDSGSGSPILRTDEINGNAVVEFDDSVPTYYEIDDVPTRTEHSTIVIANNPAEEQSHIYNGKYDEDSSFVLLLDGNGNGPRYLTFDEDGNREGPTGYSEGDDSFGEFGLYEWVSDEDGAFDITINGNDDDAETDTGFDIGDDTGGHQIGYARQRDLEDWAFDGEVAEIIRYDRALSSEERDLLRDYVNETYGIDMAE